MRFLLAIVILAALGWSGWWYLHATAREAAVTDWLAARRGDGWVAEAAGVRVTGYPNRLDTVVTGLDIADPDSGWAWRAPRFQILSLSYQPHHVIAVWPGEQVIATPLDTVRVTSNRMRGSVVFEPNTRLALDRSTIEMDAMALQGGGWRASVGAAILATRRGRDDAQPFAHDIGFNAEALVLPEVWRSGIDRAGALPDAIDSLTLDATLVFDRAWDRPAIETENPALQQLRIRDAGLTWGRLDLRARGDLVADAQGFAEGALDLRARNWREMLDIAEEAGAIGGALAGALRAGLSLMARLSGDGETIDVTLEFRDGAARLGPIPLGDAPRLSRDQRQ